MCCLCVNQHRVATKSKSVAVDFFAEFSERVSGIGHVLAMMAPWRSPTYLTRIWCIYEIYTAHQHGCDLTIIMPPAQKAAFEYDLFGRGQEDFAFATPATQDGDIDALYHVLANIQVQNARASMDQDRVTILQMIEDSIGYANLNAYVNELLRAWVRRVILEEISEKRRNFDMGHTEGKFTPDFASKRPPCFIAIGSLIFL